MLIGYCRGISSSAAGRADVARSLLLQIELHVHNAIGIDTVGYYRRRAHGRAASSRRLRSLITARTAQPPYLQY